MFQHQSTDGPGSARLPSSERHMCRRDLMGGVSEPSSSVMVPAGVRLRPQGTPGAMGRCQRTSACGAARTCFRNCVWLAAWTSLMVGSPSSAGDVSSLYGRENAGELVQLWAVAGRSARLPCDTRASPADRLRLVLWYHGTGGTPIYTYDTRGGSGGGGSHWADAAVDRSRVAFESAGLRSALVISTVRPGDQQLYRCRVDFLLSPTRNSRVNLTVVVPLAAPSIREAVTGQLVSGKLESLLEGDTVRLVCSCDSGRPLANVTWWRDNALVDASWERSADGVTSNQLTLGPLGRADHAAQLTCWAANHALTTPLSQTVTLLMILRPLRVALVGPGSPLSAGRPHQLTCQTFGSRPPAQLTWWMAGTQLTGATQSTSQRGNLTQSSVTLTPRPGQSGFTVKCRALNPALAGDVIEASRRLTVYYAPMVRLRLMTATRRRLSAPVEGGDARLHCLVSADPPARSVHWYFQGRPLNRSHTEQRNATLLLRRLRAGDRGVYTCAARNSEGRGQSPPLHLTVSHLPNCKRYQKRSYETARGETVNVTCEVDSFPPPKTFFWLLNSTNGTWRLPESWVRSRQGVSVASVEGTGPQQQRTLLCWAQNTLGTQTEPCVFALRLADRAARPRHCQVRARSARTLAVRCRAGSDSAGQQLYRLEVVRADTGALVLNTSSHQPTFEVRGLQPGSKYLLLVYASNEEGRSSALVLSAATLLDPRAARTAEIVEQWGGQLEARPVLGMLAGLAGALLLLAAAIVLAMRVRGTGHLQQQQQQQQQRLAAAAALDRRVRTVPGRPVCATDLRWTPPHTHHGARTAVEVYAPVETAGSTAMRHRPRSAGSIRAPGKATRHQLEPAYGQLLPATTEAAAQIRVPRHQSGPTYGQLLPTAGEPSILMETDTPASSSEPLQSQRLHSSAKEGTQLDTTDSGSGADLGAVPDIEPGGGSEGGDCCRGEEAASHIRWLHQPPALSSGRRAVSPPDRVPAPAVEDGARSGSAPPAAAAGWRR